MIVYNQFDFYGKKLQYKDLRLIKTDKNGSVYYEGMTKCDRCDGEGVVYSHVCNDKKIPVTPDQGICWKCFGTGLMKVKIKIVTVEYEKKLIEKAQKAAQKRKIEAEENMKKTQETTRNSNLELGYKEIDITIAEWVNVPLVKYKYYRVAHETQNAYLFNLLDDLYQRDSQAVSRWVPKKAVRFNREAV